MWNFNPHYADWWLPEVGSDFLLRDADKLLLIDLPVVTLDSADTTVLQYYLLREDALRDMSSFRAETWGNAGGWSFATCVDVRFELNRLDQVRQPDSLSGNMVYVLSVKARSRCPDSLQVSVD